MIEQLTEREAEILKLISQGMSNQKVADTLVVSRGTIKAHTHNIYGKLGVKSRTQAILRAQELGLVETDTASIATEHTQAYLPAPRLPVATNPLIGRDDELARINNLLSDERVRLVTILGAGGMGKTHIAMEVAHQQRNNFAEGVYYISLATQKNAQNIALTIMNTMGLQVKTDDALDQQLLSFLGDKSVLLVLDNFEHLLDGADFITELLQHTPNVSLLVTSRERLRLSAEVIVVLEGLNYVISDENNPLSTSAVQLFAHCAQRVQPDVQFNADSLPSLQQICQLTQGMPLALILAASWFEMLSLDEIASEMTRSMDILQSQFRDLPQRQRNMSVMIATSWERLAPSEQRVLAYLSVFRGGFSRRAAQDVADASLQQLQTLVDRSFLTVHNGRYACHELLRQYAKDALQHVTNVTEIYNRHSALYLNWLAEAEADIKGGNQIQAIQDIHIEFDNIQQAWEWAIVTHRVEWMDSALETMYVFFMISARMAEGVIFFRQALKTLQERAEKYASLINRLLIRLNNLRLLYSGEPMKEGEIEVIMRGAESSESILEKALALDLKAMTVGYIKRDFENCVSLLAEAIELFRVVGDQFYLAAAHHRMGYFKFHMSGIEDLIVYTEKAYEIAEQAGNFYNVRMAMGNLGSAYLYLGEYDKAEAYYRRSEPEKDIFGETESRTLQINFTFPLILQGKIDEAQQLLDDAWYKHHGTVEAIVLSYSYALYGLLEIFDDEPQQALDNAQRCLQEVRDDITVVLLAHLVEGMAFARLQAWDHAEQSLIEAWKLAHQLARYASATWGLPLLVMLCHHRGDFEHAVQYNALVRHHPLSAKGWLDYWETFVQTEQALKEAVDQTDYAELWTQGQSIDLEMLVTDLIDSKSSETA